MSEALSISSQPEVETGLNYSELFADGLSYIQSNSSRNWTDYNVHDPGITILELACYALTDLSFRACLPVADLLATATNNAASMAAQFYSARKILPNRALTFLDYRKLLIDLPKVKNAWIAPAQQVYDVDTVNGVLSFPRPSGPVGKTVSLQGLYNVTLEYSENISAVDKNSTRALVRQTLEANRDLCEDFVGIFEVALQYFRLCAEVEVAADAEVAAVQAEIYFYVQEYLAPSVVNRSLDEMLSRMHSDGTPFTPDEIFNGPVLSSGFIDDDELMKSELRQVIYLSDLIAIIMDIKGVLAVRDIVINPEDTTVPVADKWIVPVNSGTKATLDSDPGHSRIVFYKKNMPIPADATEVESNLYNLQQAAEAKAETPTSYDLPIPLGAFRDPGSYYSFQNHFPMLFGLSEYGLVGGADEARKALAYQLKAYLLFFDQIMANCCAQLANLRALFSTEPSIVRTYFSQVVDTFSDSAKIYAVNSASNVDSIMENLMDADQRRNRFLDHHIARYAEDFTEFAQINRDLGNTSPLVSVKCAFLAGYPRLSSERGLAYNYSLSAPSDLWNSDNISGLERRVASLLGIADCRRRDLTDGTEGMYLLEMILLRPLSSPDPFVPICSDPNCTDCADCDPYSYRIHVILPAYAGRFQQMPFRRFAEEVIRQETPAHIVPRICWINKDDMTDFQAAYRDWIGLEAGADVTNRTAKLQKLIDILCKLRNVYPPQKLHDCAGAGDKFVLDQSPLGTLQVRPQPISQLRLKKATPKRKRH